MPAQILTYPKAQFSRAEVLKEKNRFHYPKAWEFKEDRRNYYLVLHESWMKEHYFMKKPQKNAMQIGRSIGKRIMGH